MLQLAVRLGSEISPDGALADLLRDGGNEQQRNDAARYPCPRRPPA